MGFAWIRTRTQMRTCAGVCACRHTRASTSGGSSCDVSPILESLANFSTIFSLALSISSCGGGCACVCVCVCVCMKYTNSSAQRCNARTHTSSMHCTLKSVCNTASPPALRPPPALVLALAPPRSSFCAAHTSLLLIHPHTWGVCACVL